MTARTPQDPAADSPLSVRAARASVPGGPAASPRTAAGGKTSRPAQAPRLPGLGGTPGPETARPGPAAVRARVKTPAGGERVSPREATSLLPAGTTAIAAAMSEDRGPDSLDAHVRKLCRDLGLRAYHTHDSRRSPAGFPDLVITGKRTIYRELKREGKNPTEAQQDWLDALAAALDDAAVWRPSDLLSGRIQSELVAISWLGGM